MEKLEKVNSNMGILEYKMYQDIPMMEIGSRNFIYGKDYLEFKKYIEQCIEEETIANKKLYDATTNRYIYYVDDYPIGEVGIRTSLNQFWKMRGSQIFYKIRVSERQKGYGTKMMRLVLEECKRLGFEQVRINCDDLNYGSKKLILGSGGKVDIDHYKTNEGTSSSYIIKIKRR